MSERKKDQNSTPVRKDDRGTPFEKSDRSRGPIVETDISTGKLPPPPPPAKSSTD
jgi:hypothetical protein